ncbi:hypothetical protein Gogos_001291 [Gossypium gossypioides]|uniref:DUF4283 domain-containing protein n=1 Tax=Gossypium gossypioides TaxID=34282 RepID=A0A7J9CVT1_GOSGO|nr:hypothetical protein [Gossypium gossypioides]
MGESGGDGREKRDEISLLTEELIQLSVKRSMVVPRQNLFLIVFELEEDLELIMEGKPWLFRKSLILFDRVGYGLSDCSELNPAEKIKIREDPPYTLALKAKSNLIGKESIKYNDFSKKVRAQCSYTGGSEVEAIEDKITREVNSLNGMIHGRLQSSGEEKMMKKHEEVSTVTKDEQMVETKSKQICSVEAAYEDETKRLKKDGENVCGEIILEAMINAIEQSDVQLLIGSAVAKRQVDRTQ